MHTEPKHSGRPKNIKSPHRIHAEDANVTIISDLHKYSGISTFSKGSAENDPEGNWRRRQRVFESFKQSDYVVFNGDIFDIECCKAPEAKIKEAVEWLKERINDAPDTQFHFVLGNHESFLAFIKAMEALEQDPEVKGRFHFHEHYLQLNDALFVHGDEYLGVPLYNKTYNQEILPPTDEMPKLQNNEGVRRRELKEISNTGRLAYEWFNRYFHRVQNMWNRPETSVGVLSEKIVDSDIEGVAAAFTSSKHVFLGHTHHPYRYERDGRTYYNTGAAVKGDPLKFKPLEVEMHAGRVNEVESLLDKSTRPAVVHPEHGKKQYMVISDLHLFLHCETPEALAVNKHKMEIDSAMQAADVIVLNGDIFELFYTENPKQAMDQAEKWLRDLAKKYSDKEIHFVLGNHEGVDEFITKMKTLSENNEFPNLHVHERYFRPNDKNIFIHGDEIIKGKHKARRTWGQDTATASKMAFFANRIGEKPGMAVVRNLRNPARASVNIVSALPTIPDVQHVDAIKNVFFGHTHVPFIDHEVQGKWVTNTGGATPCAEFGAVSFSMAEDGTIDAPKRIYRQGASNGVAVG